MKPITVSAIVPTLNEEAVIAATLAALSRSGSLHEILICDAGSDDATPEIVTSFEGAALLPSQRGRAQQMNCGAAHASGEVLWFVHADTIVPPGAVERIVEVMQNEACVGGAFSFKLDSERSAYRIIEWGVRQRSRWFGVPYGDQGIFVRRSVFAELGGFPEVALMEDLALWRLLRSKGTTKILKDEVLTSPRRWERRGVLRTTLENWAVVLLEHLGAKPETLLRVRP